MLTSALRVVSLASALLAAGCSHAVPEGGGKARSVLYYQDPMHPAYKSDKPGIAPDCGMHLVPVYSDAAPPTRSPEIQSSSLVHIDAENQRRIGLKVASAEVTSGTRQVRLFGRVTSDETRVYRVNGPMDGWIRSVESHSLGDRVKKTQILATFYSRELRSAALSHFLILDRIRAQGEIKDDPFEANGDRNNLALSLETLHNLGVDDIDIRDMEATRKIPEEVILRSPAEGFILARNVSVGQRFSRGEELFRISDLRRVWILASTQEHEAAEIERGASAGILVRHSPRSIPATVADSLPQFDAQSQSLKLRLEADNPNLLLKPDMFVDVEIKTKMPAGLTVPAEAVLDSGASERVFLDLGDGNFKSRNVETGWRTSDRIQIVNGLKAGEKVVVSGHFLIDSEARLKSGAAPPLPDAHR